MLSGGTDRLRNLCELLHELVMPRVSVDEVDAVDDAQNDCGEGAVNGKCIGGQMVVFDARPSLRRMT